MKSVKASEVKVRALRNFGSEYGVGCKLLVPVALPPDAQLWCRRQCLELELELESQKQVDRMTIL